MKAHHSNVDDVVEDEDHGTSMQSVSTPEVKGLRLPSEDAQVSPTTAAVIGAGASSRDASKPSSGELQVEVKEIDRGRNDETVPTKVDVGTSHKVASQPAGESTLPTRRPSETTDAQDIDGQPQTEGAKTMPTVTSYQSLEGTLKGSSTADAHDSANSSKDTSNGKETFPPSTIVVEAHQKGPTTLAHAKEPSSGPPKVITAKASARPAASSPSSSKSTKGTALRRGKWTVEEEAYVARVIQDFNSGFLDAPAGTTLRTYLSEKLQCDPMRITKKFTGDACIGKRVFHPAVRSPSNAAIIDKAQVELDALERRWRRRLEIQQRESAKKAAASAAAVAAGRGSNNNGLLHHHPPSAAADGTVPQENVVTRTASWLERAKTVLEEPPTNGGGNSVHCESDDLLQTQMQKVQRLIHEGPIIQQTSADLPDMLDQAEQQAAARAAATSPSNTNATAATEPADKRLRTAEDAEALVGFLRSVRASAASGEDF